MRLVTYRRRTASAGAGSIGALTDGGVVDLSAVAGSMLELLGGGRTRRGTPDDRRAAAPSSLATRCSCSRRCRGPTRSATSCSSRSTCRAARPARCPRRGTRSRSTGRATRTRSSAPRTRSAGRLHRQARLRARALRRHRPPRADGVRSRRRARAIAGYTIFNDWSARDIQFREMEVSLGPGLGKDFASSIGPCIATPDEFDSRRRGWRPGSTARRGPRAGSGRCISRSRRSSRTSRRSSRCCPATCSAAAPSAAAAGWSSTAGSSRATSSSSRCEGIGILRNTVGARPEVVPAQSIIGRSSTHDQGDPAGLSGPGRRGQDGGDAARSAATTTPTRTCSTGLVECSKAADDLGYWGITHVEHHAHSEGMEISPDAAHAQRLRGHATRSA